MNAPSKNIINEIFYPLYDADLAISGIYFN